MIRIPLSMPEIGPEDIESVSVVLKTGRLSLGPKIEEFEEKVAAFAGSRYAIAVNSGTSGLHLCIKAAGITKGEEVITTPFSFIASANCILYENAVPVFVDIDPETLNLDVNRIEDKITARTKAILPVHVFGSPCPMDRIMGPARRHGLRVIEDACEAIGAEYNGRRVGSAGLAGVFAFYPNKQMTMGEGGVIVTNNRKVAESCRSLRNQGRSGDGRWLRHARLGYNYRLTDMQCALGISQLKRLDEMLADRERVAGYYLRRLAHIEGVIAPSLPEEGKLSWFVFVVRLNESYGRRERNRLMQLLQGAGVETGNYFPPIHLQPFYRKTFGYKKGDFPVTESVSDRTIALPFYNALKENEVAYVCDALKTSLALL